MNIRKKALKGLVWTSIGAIGSGIIGFGITMILARILEPYEFGIMEVVIVFTVISTVFVDSGFSQAIIRDKNPSQEDLSSVFFLQIIVALTIYVILFFAAPFIGSFFEFNELISLTRFVFLVIILDSFTLVQNANLARQLDFIPNAKASIIAIIIAGTVAIVIAINGGGVWALAANVVITSLMRNILIWRQIKWKPSFEIKKKSIKKYYNFGRNLLLQSLIDKIVSNAESILIGRIYNKSTLGYYSQAKTLNAYLSQTTTNIIQKVTYPSLALISKDHPKQLKEGYRKILGMTMCLIVPIMLFTIISSDNFIRFIFGEKWIKSAEYLRLISFWGLLYPVSSICSNIFLVLGKSKLLLKISSIRQVLRIIVMISLVKISIISMLYGIIFSAVITTFIYTYIAGNLINYKQKEMFNDLFKTFINGIIAIGAVYLIGIYMPNNNHLSFIVQIIVMIFSYIVLNKYLFVNPYFYEVIKNFKIILKKK